MLSGLAKALMICKPFAADEFAKALAGVDAEMDGRTVGE